MMDSKIFILVIFAFLGVSNSAYFNGTYWYIYTCQDLANLSLSGNKTANAILANNIDCDGLYNTGTGWPVIGVSAAKYSGIFDGNFYNVSNLYINRTTGHQYGLFGYTNGATIKNLGVINITIVYSAITTEVGGLAGRTYTGTIEKSFVTNSYIGGEFAVGGLVGTVEGTTINNTYTSNSTINTAITAGKGGAVGGLIGRYITINGNVNNSYSSARVIGQNDPSRDGVGGLIGYWDITGKIHNSFYSGVITVSNNPFGAFVGKNNSAKPVTFINDYYDSNTSTVNSCMRSYTFGLINVSDCNNQNAGTPQYFYNSSKAPLSSWNSSWWAFNIAKYPWLKGSPKNLMVDGPYLRLSVYSSVYNNTNITYTVRSSIYNQLGISVTGVNLTVYANGTLINNTLVTVAANTMADYNTTWTTTRPILDANLTFTANITNTSVLIKYNVTNDTFIDILPIDPPSALKKQGYSMTPTMTDYRNFTWQQITFGSIVMSGTSDSNWTWRVFQHGSGRYIPNGTQYGFSWVPE